MKKLFLLGLAAAMATGSFSANAGDYGVQTFKPGLKLELVWANANDAKTLAGCRVGTGTNNKFYLNDYANGTVKVYDETGFVKDIKVADFIWVSNNADNAGHIIARADTEKWPGSTSYAGAGATTATAFYVIDSKTDEVISKQLVCPNRPAGRGDAFGHINFDVANDFWILYHCFETAFAEIMFNGTESCTGSSSYPIKIGEEFKGTNAAKGQTLGIAQPFGRFDEENGQFLDLAVFANNYLGLTGTAGGFGNGIRHYTCTIGQEATGDITFTWNPEQEYFITPDHSSINGFMVFELAGKQWVVYPAGESGGVNSSDAFGIAEVTYADTPKSAADQREKVLAARLYGQTNDAGGILNPAKANYMSFNVEPVDGDPNSVYIYSFAQQGAMVVTKFTVDNSGIEDLLVEDENAPVEYYNLQGIRVENPANGIFIRRKGHNSSKIVL